MLQTLKEILNTKIGRYILFVIAPYMFTFLSWLLSGFGFDYQAFVTKEIFAICLIFYWVFGSIMYMAFTAEAA